MDYQFRWTTSRSVSGVKLDSSKDITSPSWSPFEGLKLYGENKGGDNPLWPWEEETTLGSKIRRGPHQGSY